MTCKIILIRGNSGSGKTTVAQQIAAKLPDSMLISQDVFRREILREPDHMGNKSITLMQANIAWARTNVHYLVIEGILKRQVYGEMLTSLHESAGAQMHTYYFDLPFEVAFARNQSRAVSFPEETLRQWWQQDDELGFEDGLLTADMALPEQVARILGDLASPQTVL